MVNVLKECDYHQSDERKGIKKLKPSTNDDMCMLAMQYVHIYVQAARRHLLRVYRIQQNVLCILQDTQQRVQIIEIF